jgi:methylmalonyl-CoA/ethylmalonyl-CoA epimerase
MIDHPEKQLAPAPAVPMEISQIAIVVRDMEQSLRTYTNNCGWGPWKVFEYDKPLLHDTRLRGEPVDFTMIGAETTVGSIGFELIQPVSGPSIYQEFLDEHGEGVQHIACMMHNDADSATMKQHWADRGIDILMSGRIGDTIEFYYLDSGPLLKFVLESGSGHAIDLQPTYVFP